MRNLVIAALLFLNVSEAGACLSQTRPLEDAEYESIVLGEVVGVRLTGYSEVRWQEMEKRRPHPCPKVGQELASCVRLLEEFGDAVAPSCPGVGRKIVERIEADLSSR